MIPQDQGSQASAGWRHRQGTQRHPNDRYGHVRMSGDIMVACRTLRPSLDRVIGVISEEFNCGRLGRTVKRRFTRMRAGIV